MRRLLACLPLFLVLAPCTPPHPPASQPPTPSMEELVSDDDATLPGAAHRERLAAVGGSGVWTMFKVTLPGAAQIQRLVLIGGSGTWLVFHASPPSTDQMEQLAREDPIAFLENTLRRYKREVKSYSVTFHKQERIDGKLQKKELIEACFREEPHSVYFRWTEGARKAERALYVAGENNGKMLARPEGALARKLVGDIVERDVDGADARQSSRYPLSEFGLKTVALRTLASWKAAKEKDALHIEFLGEVKVAEAGDRLCYKFRRTRYQKPEEDGITELTAYIDKETWLQVGTVLKGKDGELIAEYYFRDIKLNPEFKEKQFTREALKP